MSAVRAEVLKVRTVPGLLLGAVAATLLHPLASLLVATTGGVADDTSLVAASTTGGFAGLLAWALWAAIAAAGEHQHGTIGPSLLALAAGDISAQPRHPRARLLLAKAVGLGAVAAAGAAGGSVLALGLVRAVLPGDGRAAGDPLVVLAAPVLAAAVTVLGVVVGLALPTTASAAAVVAAVLLVPRAAGGLLGVLEPWVVGLGPGTVLARLAGLDGPTSQTFPPGAPAALLALVLGAGGGLVAAVVAARR